MTKYNELCSLDTIYRVRQTGVFVRAFVEEVLQWQNTHQISVVGEDCRVTRPILHIGNSLVCLDCLVTERHLAHFPSGWLSGWLHARATEGGKDVLPLSR